MGISYNTAGITNSLILSVDAANIKSNKGNRSLINWNNWSVGLNGVTGYNANQTIANETGRAVSTDPWGNSAVVWQCYPTGDSNGDGGWNTDWVNADITKTYRFSVWLRRTSATSGGTTYLGLHTNGVTDTIDLATGLSQTNPYWDYRGSGSWTQNQWYLVVGHLFPYGYTGTTAHPDSGVYTVAGGTTKVSALAGNIVNDVKFPADATTIYHRTYLYYCLDNTTRVEFFQPRIDIIDGTQPTISDLVSNVGSTWYNLTGSSTTNGLAVQALPQISTDGGGCFDFTSNAGLNATTAFCGFSWPNQPIPTSGSFTINCWVKNVPATVGQQALFSNSADANGFRFGVGVNGVYWLIGPTYLEGQANYTDTFTNTQWNNVCMVFDRASIIGSNSAIYMYLNGVLQSTTSLASYPQFAWPAAGYTTAYMAKGLATFPSFSGKLGKFEIYSTALTSNDIVQNFNALKGRFGL